MRASKSNQGKPAKCQPESPELVPQAASTPDPGSHGDGHRAESQLSHNDKNKAMSSAPRAHQHSPKANIMLRQQHVPPAEAAKHQQSNPFLNGRISAFAQLSKARLMASRLSSMHDNVNEQDYSSRSHHKRGTAADNSSSAAYNNNTTTEAESSNRCRDPGAGPGTKNEYGGPSAADAVGESKAGLPMNLSIQTS